MTYEAHKEYLAQMYEEYQRQEEENIKKGKKGFVSTISGLSAQPSNIKGGAELRESDDSSQTPESEKEYESADSLLAERKRCEEHLKGTEMADGVMVDVHELLVDIRAEKVEATEVKLDDLESESEGVSENGSLVGMGSLLDNVYCAAVKKLNNNVSSTLDDQNSCPLIALDDEKEPIRNGSNLLFGKVAARMEESLLSGPGPVQPLVAPHQERPVHANTSEELSQLVHLSGSDLGSLPSILEKEEFELQPSSEGDRSDKVPFKTSKNPDSKTASREDALAKTININSDMDRPSDSQEKEKKIQTSTTQVGLKLNHNVFNYIGFWDAVICHAEAIHLPSAVNLTVVYPPHPVSFIPHDRNMNKKETPDVKNTQQFWFHLVLLSPFSHKYWPGFTSLVW